MPRPPAPEAPIAGLLAIALLASACAQERPGPERVVLIVADTLRRDFVSAYAEGQPKVPTPNLQALADAGTVFTNAVSSFHQTSMSMSALFTGRTPSLETGDPGTPLPWTSTAWCGLSRLARSPDDGCIPRHLDTLAEDFRATGYETIGVVANRLLFRPYGYEQGFDTWIEVGSPELVKGKRARREEAKLRDGARVNQQVFAALDRRESDRFFLYVHYVDPHEYGIRPDIPEYGDGVRHLDEVVGRLLADLERRGLLAGAVVVFTSDHGENLGAKHALEATPKHFGNPSFDPLLRVPLIVTPPVPGDPSRLVRSQDLRGLLRELAGLPSLPDRDLQPDELFLSETFFQTYRRGRYKSVRHRGDGPSALFDLEADPGETRDVAADHPEVVRAHRERVAELTRQLGTRRGADAEMSEDDAERLRALGYLE